VEEKVYAALGDEGEKDSCHWVLDTGASNHMSGCWATFSSIDGGTVGTVRFVDGSVVKIVIIGSVLYECKNGEH
jgi:glutamate dehydrogenase/leucine dehydrogenase